MENILESMAQSFFGSLGIGVIFLIFYILYFFSSKIRDFIYEKIYRRPYWTEERKEKLSLKIERGHLLNKKEKIAEENTIKEMQRLRLDAKRDWQKYYQIQNEEIKKIENRIVEIDKKIIFLSNLIKKYKK